MKSDRGTGHHVQIMPETDGLFLAGMAFVEFLRHQKGDRHAIRSCPEDGKYDFTTKWVVDVR